jgi:hypothetical protein
VSQLIAPGTLCNLADGDVITFGKTVGKDNGVVRPVIARVRYIYSSPRVDTPPSPASAAGELLHSTSASPVAASLPGSSGRYGIYTPAMTSSESDSSSESEVEEIPRVEMQPSVHSPLSLSWGMMRGAHPHYAHAMHHLHHTRHAHPVGHVSSQSARLGLLRRILPQIQSIEEIAAGHGSSRFSPISVSSISRSPSVVEVSPEEARESPPARQLSVVGAFPDSIRSSRAQSPMAEDAGEDMDIESEAPSEYSSKRAEPADIDSNTADADSNTVDADSTPFRVLMVSSRICTPEPAGDDVEEMYATPAPEFEEDVRVGEEEVHIAESGGPSAPVVVPTAAAGQEPFELRVEALKTKVAVLEQRLKIFNSDENEIVADTPEKQQMIDKKPAEEDIKSLKGMLQGKRSWSPCKHIQPGCLVALEELRKKAEADLAEELNAIRVARAEAEAAAAAAAKLGVAAAADKHEVRVHHAGDARETHAAQAVGESPAPPTGTATLKRKREALEDDDAQVAPRVVSCQAVFDRLAVEPPHKRTRTSYGMAVAKRVVASVVKTTAIAAVGAVATWSVLAFS